MKNLLLIFCVISSPLIFPVFSQNPEWINYTNGTWISSIAVEGDKIWTGTNGGLVQIDKETGTSTFYNKANSGIPGNKISYIAIDESGDKWIGVNGYGLVKFDGSTWTVYADSNSVLSSDYISCITIDKYGNKWIGTDHSGLVMFDGDNWEVYNRSNSGLPG